MLHKQLITAGLALASSLALAQGDAAKGQALFAAQCGFCHSPKPARTSWARASTAYDDPGQRKPEKKEPPNPSAGHGGSSQVRQSGN